MTERRPHYVFLDYLRVIACLMVILVHATEFFYLADDSISVADRGDLLIVAVLNSACREAVPLFVMASSFLLVPLRGSVKVYARRRVSRVFIPFVVWSLFYAIVPDMIAGNTTDAVLAKLGHLLYNFNLDSGHLWYIYMLFGVYLIIPVISPWLQQASKRAEEVFLSIWGISTLYEYVSPVVGGWLGECAWNDFHSLYYYSGFIGYVVLAHYIKVHLRLSPAMTVIMGWTAFIAGYLFTTVLFYNRGLESTDYSFVETSFRFCTFNVALMSFGLFLLISRISSTASWLYRPVKDFAALSYGIYLAHLFILVTVYGLLSPHFNTLSTIILCWLSTAALSYLLIKLLSLIPGGRYFAGISKR